MVFDKDGKVSIKSNKKVNRYSYTNPKLNINPNQMYNITCTKKIVDEELIENKVKTENHHENDIVEL